MTISEERVVRALMDHLIEGGVILRIGTLYRPSGIVLSCYAVQLDSCDQTVIEPSPCTAVYQLTYFDAPGRVTVETYINHCADAMSLLGDRIRTWNTHPADKQWVSVHSEIASTYDMDERRGSCEPLDNPLPLQAIGSLVGTLCSMRETHRLSESRGHAGISYDWTCLFSLVRRLAKRPDALKTSPR